MVRLADGTRMQCHPRGRRQDCVVGDRVQWQRSGDQGVIETVAPRRNLLFRQDAMRTKPFAANLDQILVLVAATPPFSESVLSRALIAAAAADIPVLLVLNKIDRPEVALARERLAPYRALGLDGLELSLKQAPEEALARLRPCLAGRSTLVLGPSGMGKSTLINLMVPDAGAQTGEISVALNAGRHTTTATTWYAIQAGGALIDSPGFQTFGLHHLKPLELAGLMPDVAPHASNCLFS
ncbi:MAG: ribosome small subunit-dependent GTPase A, partial [Aquabacterium sp.]